jgi:hypothetical protein
MNEELTEAIDSNEALAQSSGRHQYQHQTMTLHNTVGLVFMSIFAFILLVALLRQQTRYQALAVELAHHLS